MHLKWGILFSRKCEVHMHSCCHGNIHYSHHLILSKLFAPLIVSHVRSNLSLLLEHAKFWKFRRFWNFDYTKTAKMPEIPFSQIDALNMWYFHIRRHFNDVIFFFWCEDNMGDMLILIIYSLRLNLVHFDWNWHTKCKNALIPIYYNGHTV